MSVKIFCDFCSERVIPEDGFCPECGLELMDSLATDEEDEFEPDEDEFIKEEGF